MNSATAPTYYCPPAIVREQRTESMQASGDEGRFLEDRIFEIRRAFADSRQWQAVIKQVVAAEDASADENRFSVSSLNVILPKRTYSRRVRYHFAGRGRPLPYDEFNDNDTDEA